MIASSLNDVGRARLALLDAMDRAALVQGANVNDPHSINRWSTGEALRNASARLQEFGIRNTRAFLQDALDTERHLSITVGVVDLVKEFEAYLAAVRASTACHICDADKGASCVVAVRSRDAEPVRKPVEWVCADRASRAEVVR